MKINIRNVTQKGYYVFALAFVAMLLVPALANKVSAGQVTSRSVKLSDSTVSATGVTYELKFTPTGGSPANIGGIVLDICSGASTPIIGDTTCTYPTGFDFGTTPTFNIISGIGTGGTWVTTNSLQGGAGAGQVQVLKLTNTTAQAVTAATPVVIDFTAVTNTSTVGTFYGRIVTFDTSAHAVSSYTATGATRAAAPFTGQIDYGGVALSTAAVITVTAKVQEQLTFCIYTTSCGVGTAVTLGNTQGVLSTSGAFVDKTTKYDVQTNAASGAAVNVKGNTLTDPVTSSTIAAINAGGAAAVSTPGTSQFGLCTYEATGTNLTPNSNYDGSNAGP
ncbi:MAG TPA: hypothetical protein VLG47_01325, partial [Candidatus Saccharimonadales bacterium]|nr:hypothetical protein [Candidatus Saccharimonadales bacterium]